MEYPTLILVFRQRLQDERQGVAERIAKIVTVPHLRKEYYELARRLDVVHAAQDRLGQGTYGRCVRCGGDLELSVLEDDPAASTCVSCSDTRPLDPPQEEA